ncbi:hypothetical protein [Limosilactobacillus oris]|jgi:hypothetical protein|uniref:hypothetical protein n=1 Tax=Limosilactobacillus oris TaxID=1632 RepID=UPI0022E7F0CA|nr:hypothetical protein [Limosilactobacillus oris]
MPPRIKRDSISKEAKQQLIVSLNDLKRDAEAYDKGNFYAVNRSSVTLRSLFYHSKRAPSLIQQLHLENSLYLNSYAPIKTAKDIGNFGDLYAARFLHFNPLSGKHEYQNVNIFNPFNHRPHKLPFSEWWEEPMIFFDKEVLTRHELIIASANEDGGAHFDKAFKAEHRAYYNFKTGRTGYQAGEPVSPWLMQQLFGGIHMTNSPQYIKLQGTTLALLRQIIHEVIPSLSSWQKLNVNYDPDFDYNWKRKLNYIGWHLAFTKNDN